MYVYMYRHAILEGNQGTPLRISTFVFVRNLRYHDTLSHCRSDPTKVCSGEDDDDGVEATIKTRLIEAGDSDQEEGREVVEGKAGEERTREEQVVLEKGALEKGVREENGVCVTPAEGRREESPKVPGKGEEEKEKEEGRAEKATEAEKERMTGIVTVEKDVPADVETEEMPVKETAGTQPSESKESSTEEEAGTPAAGTEEQSGIEGVGAPERLNEATLEGDLDDSEATAFSKSGSAQTEETPAQSLDNPPSQRQVSSLEAQCGQSEGDTELRSQEVDSTSNQNPPSSSVTEPRVLES